MRRIVPESQTAADDLGYGPRSWDAPQFLGRGQIESEMRMPTAVLERGGPVMTLPAGPELDLESMTFTDPLTERPWSGAQFLDRRLYTDGLLVFHNGGIRYETYRNGLTPSDHHILHSVSKTLTTMQMGIAIGEGLVDPDAPIRSYLAPLCALPAWNDVTVQHVLDMATGIKCDEHYEDPDSMYWRYAEVAGYYGLADPSPGGVIDFVVENLTEQEEPPGHRFNYASYLTNLLPACLAEVYGRPAVELFEEQLHQRLGCEHDALVNCDSTGAPIVEGQLCLTLRDFARWALLFLHQGRNLAGEQVVPSSWIAEATAADPARRAAFVRGDSVERFPGAEYHNQAWVLDPDAGVMAMLGIHGQFAYVDRPRDLLIIGVSSYPTQVDLLGLASTQELWHTVTTTLTREFEG